MVFGLHRLTCKVQRTPAFGDRGRGSKDPVPAPSSSHRNGLQMMWQGFLQCDEHHGQRVWNVLVCSALLLTGLNRFYGLTTGCSDKEESFVKKCFLLMAALAITFTIQGAANAQQSNDARQDRRESLQEKRQDTRQDCREHRQDAGRARRDNRQSASQNRRTNTRQSRSNRRR